MVQACTHCGGTDIDYDPAQGNSVCTQCGCVLEENTIVSEVGFAENAEGGTSVVGQFVSAGDNGTSGTGLVKESREATIGRGRQRIAALAASLRLKGHHQDAANRLFMLAVQHNFIQGRKTQNVIAACLYIVCRKEKTPHMLIDFSDVLQTNVYVLGNCFMKFCRLLHLTNTLPIIDPSLYIHRFAGRLEFGDKMHLVAMSALRLVQRMKRDWIQTGRRPSGICGAALLIAARLHGFRRTQKEIVSVVRICDVTLRKRLYEFQETPCSQLTPQQFNEMDLETLPECDPPAFKAARVKEARELMLKAKEAEEEAEDPPGTLMSEMNTALLTDEFQEIDRDTQGTSILPARSTLSTGQGGDGGEVAENDESLSDVDEAEVMQYITASTEEVELKRRVWEELNREYIQEQEEKEAARLAAGDQPVPKKRKKRDKKSGDAATAAEAAGEMLKQRKVSSNIDYSVLETLMATPAQVLLQQPTTSQASEDQASEDEQQPPSPPPPQPPSPPQALRAEAAVESVGNGSAEPRGLEEDEDVGTADDYIQEEEGAGQEVGTDYYQEEEYDEYEGDYE